jgi:glycosyltransferase involved in cell wall biosynthesis
VTSAAVDSSISVIVPVFDGEQFLGECLESVLSQTHAVDEVIVIDDGSTDGSAEVAESFAGVRVLRRDHEGVSSARNAGLAVASGALIGFCDADDRWLPTKTERQVEHLASNPDAACALCRCAIELEPGMAMPDWLAPDVVYGDLGGVLPLSGLFRRSLFDEVGEFAGESAEDFDLLVRARTAGARIDIVPEQLLIRRIHDRNTTHQWGSLAPGLFNRLREHLHGVDSGSDA